MSLMRALAAAAAIILSAPAGAADFYQGKTISIVIGSAPGGSYDAYARLLARHMGRYIPGNPSIVPRNLPGAAGIQSAHFVYEAVKDGTVLGAPLNNLVLSKLLEPDKVTFDVGSFQWLGAVASPVNVLATWSDSGVATMEDARRKPLAIGATTPGTTMEIYPLMANNLFGTKFKVVTGYVGGAEINVAMERGEVAGRGANTYLAYAFQNPDWIRDKKLNFLFQMTLERDASLPNVPTLLEMATTDEQRQVVSMMAITEVLGRFLIAPGGTPRDRIDLLRKAMADVVKDKAFLEEADKAKLEVAFIPGEKLQTLADNLLKTPLAVVQKFREATKSMPN